MSCRSQHETDSGISLINAVSLCHGSGPFLNYQVIVAENGIECSMSRKGNCWDNAVAKIFFHTLKTELVRHENYRSRTEAKASIFGCIEVFYDRQRRHSHIGQMIPLAF